MTHIVIFTMLLLDGKEVDEFFFEQAVECRDSCSTFPKKHDSTINVKIEFGEGEGN